MAGDTWAPVVLGLWYQPWSPSSWGGSRAGKGHGALPQNREQCSKVEKNSFQWSDLFSFGLSLWLNHYPVPIAQSLSGTCPL